MAIAVPNLIGLGRTAAEATLDAVPLRHIARFPFAAGGDGSATDQSPAAGTFVRKYSVVTVSYPTPFGPMDDSPVEGPTLSGPMEGQIDGAIVGGGGASIGFVIAGPDEVSLDLYRDEPVPLLPRAEWMRRGAMLGLAQRAFTNRNSVNLVVSNNLVTSIEIFVGLDQFGL